LNNALEIYLKKNVDENSKTIPWNGKERLPIYLLDQYHFYEAEILNTGCILMEIVREAPEIGSIKKHIKMIQDEAGCHVVLVYQSISSFRRKTLIENRIPFLVENGQMYLPFLGLDLVNIVEKQEDKITSFSSSTQLTFLYFLYNPELLLNTSKLAKFLNMTNMTSSRALNDLYDLGLLSYDIGGITGRSKNYQRIKDPAYYREGLKYLKNPVWKVVYAANDVEGALLAGLEALSMVTMLNPPPNPVRAISKEKLLDVQASLVNDKDRIADEKLIELEIWLYDPAMLSSANQVDKLSLTLSLKDINDERVEQAIDDMVKGEKWYTG
jgi:hypothetical protein